MKVIVIAGSLRRESFNRAAMEVAVKRLREKDIDVEELRVDSVPLVNTDLDADPPQALLDAYKKVSEADGVLIYSPENNYQIPGGLKNLLDWLSHNSSSYGNVLKDKKVAAASLAGGSAGAGVLSHLKEYFDYVYVGGNMMTDTLGLHIPAEAFQTGKLTLSDDYIEQINNHTDKFVEFIK